MALHLMSSLAPIYRMFGYFDLVLLIAEGWLLWRLA